MNDRDVRVIARATRTLLPVWLIAAWPAIQWAIVNVILPLVQAWIANRTRLGVMSTTAADIEAGAAANDPTILRALERAEREVGHA